MQGLNLPKDIAIELFGEEAFDYKDSTKDNERLLELYHEYKNPPSGLRKKGGKKQGLDTAS